MIFEIRKIIKPTEKEINKILREITGILKREYGLVLRNITNIEDGQNLNYLLQVYDVGKNEKVDLFLKILSKDGYPDVKSLAKCYELLNSERYQIIHYDSGSLTAPYGYVVQRWLKGIVRVSNSDINLHQVESEYPWLRDFCHLLKKIHSIKLNYFGDIKGLVRFASIHEYYNNIDEVIKWSFGRVKNEGIVISELVKHKVIEGDFLVYILKGIKNLGRKIGVKQSVLIHGDMFPSNIIYDNGEPILIDWDECRANWWVYEIARTTYFLESRHIALKFIEYYNPDDSLEEIDIGIRIEHIRQHLRKICIRCMNRDKDAELMEYVNSIKAKIIKRIEKPFLFDNSN